MHYNRDKIQSALKRFLLGRVATGLFGLIFLVVVLRSLEQSEFGAYTAMLALQAGMAVLSTLGIEATLERFLPELRTLRDEGAGAQLIVAGVLARGTVLITIAATAMFFVDSWAPWLSLAAFRDQIPLALLWLVLFGVFSTCSAIHEALLNQGTAQIAQTIYAAGKTTLFFLLPVALLSSGGLTRVLICEAAATAFALVFTLIMLRRGPVAGFASPSGAWAQLSIELRKRMVLFGLKNYAAQVIMLLYGPDAMRLVASSQAGLAQTGRFGAVHSFYEYIQRYLPAFMLMRLIRPVFIARYVETRDFNVLNRMASIVLKLNLLLLTPLLIVLFGAGDLILSAVSKGKYMDSGYLLFGYVALLVPMSNQWVISMVANTLEQNDVQVKAALLAVPGIAVGAFMIDRYGVSALAVGAWCSYLTYNAVAIALLRRAGFPYRPDLRALLICGSVASAAVGSSMLAVSFYQSGPLARMAIVVGAAIAAFGALLMLGLISPEERDALRVARRT